jgi:pyruvyltransferase
MNKKREIKTYWWSGADNANFGDVLGPALLEHFTDAKAVWSTADESELAIVGSIAEHLPKPYTGTIAGIGFGYRKRYIDLSEANVLALRGEYSFRASKLKDKPLLADPGLVAPDLVQNLSDKKTYKIGVIGHHRHRDIDVPEGGLFIDIKWPIEDVIQAAASCEEIHSSSLHGIILADALFIPRKWVYFDGVQGNGHKFHDYFSSIRQLCSPNQTQIAKEKIIKQKQDRIREMLKCL